MTRISRPLMIAALGLALVLLAACGSNGTTGATDTPTPTPSPSNTTFTEAEWTIQTPNGWTREEYTKNADAKKAIRYRDPSGNYVIVAIDPLGSDFAYDALWRYQVKDGDRFEIVERYDCAGKQDESCKTDDARFDGYVLWKSGTTPEKAGGHTWYFIFGSTSSTAVDLNAFETILESIRVSA